MPPRSSSESGSVNKPHALFQAITGLLVIIYLGFILQYGARVSLILLTLMAFTTLPLFISKRVLTVETVTANPANRYILGAFLFYSLVWLIDVLVSDRADVSELERPIKVLICVALFLYFSVVRVDAKFLLIGLCASVSVLAFMLYQSFGTAEDNRYGLGLNQNALAYLITAEVLLLSALLSVYKKVWVRIFISAFIVTGFVVSLYTGSRVIFLCYGGFLIIFLWVHRRELTLKGVTAAAFVALFALFLAWKNDSISSRFIEIKPEIEAIYSGDYSSSLGHRAGLYKLWFISIEDRFLLGADDLELSDMAELAQAQGLISLVDRDWLASYSHFHNEYLNTLMFRGILGLLSLVSVLAIPFFVTERDRKLLLSAVLTPLLLGGLVDSPFTGGTYLVFVFVMVALVANLRIGSPRSDSQEAS
ncbi:MAG TPA: O-antigen ligase family protein [Marinobacterium sp.]|nr:O-antigen ligase family protein [Marinobacterium sp.]